MHLQRAAFFGLHVPFRCRLCTCPNVGKSCAHEGAGATSPEVRGAGRPKPKPDSPSQRLDLDRSIGAPGALPCDGAELGRRSRPAASGQLRSCPSSCNADLCMAKLGPLLERARHRASRPFSAAHFVDLTRASLLQSWPPALTAVHSADRERMVPGVALSGRPHRAEDTTRRPWTSRSDARSCCGNVGIELPSPGLVSGRARTHGGRAALVA